MKHVHRFIAALIVLTMLITGRGVTVYADSTMKLPDDFKIIDVRAFYGDTSIDHVVLPAGVTEIRALAFANSSLKSINLPDSLTFIAYDAFQGSTLKNVYVTDDKDIYAHQWAATLGYITDDPGNNEDDVQCTAEGVEFKELTQAQIDAVTGEYERLVNVGPADYFGTEVNDVFRLGAIDADVDYNFGFVENRVEIYISTGVNLDAGENWLVLLGVNDENGVITWTSYDGVVGDSSEIVATVDVYILDGASFIAVGK